MRTLTTLILSIAMLFTIPIIASAQVFSGDLTLSTQAQVDAFNYTEVTGNLTIAYEYGTKFSDINSLQPLSKLTKVGNSLIIRYNNQLQDLQGLENLTSASGFSIIDNAQLQDLQGLNNLTNSDRGYIQGNAGLTSLKGLEKLSSLNELLIIDNDLLQNLQGLENLASTGAYGRISDNDGLTSLQGLENLTVADGGLDIINNASLTSLQGLENLSSVHIFNISNNASLTSLKGLEKLQSFFDLTIRNNPLLNDCCAIADLLSIVAEGVNIGGNGSNCNSEEIIEINCGLALNLRTQAEVDAFKYTVVNGKLIIGNPEEDAPSTDITSLKPLSILTKVKKTLLIRNNHQLQDLQGLENLTSFNELDIEANDQLHNLHGLENLTSIEGDISITSNSSLTSLQGLDNLVTVSGCSIINNDQLQDLQGLENLASVNALNIWGNAQLQDFQGLENLSSVNEIRIDNNDQLQNLKGLENLATVSGFTIINNDQLQDLQGLNNLATVSGFLISDNPQLQDLQGLENLTSLWNLYITNNDQLQDLQGLNNLSSVNGRLQIGGNDQLQNLQGLESLTTIRIFNIDDITSLQGLENLSSVTSLSIGSNEQLQDLQGLENLTSVDFFTIDNNDLLQDLKGLENLISVNVTFVIRGNDGLTSLQGLENLTTIGREFSIRNNISLTSLQGLKNLTTVEDFFWLVENHSLTSLQGLENLQLLGNLIIIDNPLLNDCCALADVLTKATGQVTISRNGSSCNSIEAIQESCEVITSFTLVDAATHTDIATFDPLADQAVINLKEVGSQLNIRANTSPKEVGSMVFELDGQIFRTENVFPYALAGDAPPGVYYPWTPTLGEHVLKATPYTQKKGKGEKGTSLTIRFTVVEEDIPFVKNFTLVNAENDQDIGRIRNGDVIHLGSLPSTQLNIRANTFPKKIGSVVFELDGKKFSTENVYPYALAGDNPPGEYHAWTPALGSHTLTATPYTKRQGQGDQGKSLTIAFEVIENDEDQMAVERTMPATSPKTKLEGEVEELIAAQHSIQVMVYPNPAEGTLSIKIPDTAQPVGLYLYNAQGHKVVETAGRHEGVLALDVSHLASGLYLLKVASGQSTAMHRILLK